MASILVGDHSQIDLENVTFHLFSNIDYTLARYKPTLHSLIYDHAKKYLVQNLRVTISN